MKTDIKDLPKGQKEITIELTVEEYKPFLEKAAEKLSQKTSIPGFRPGKASYDVLKQRLGEGEIWQAAFEFAVHKTLVDFLEEHKLPTVGQPHVDAATLAPGNPVAYKAVVSVLPEVTLADFSKISVKPKKIEIDEKRVEKSLTDLQNMRASEKLVDREAKKGDKVEIDFDTFQDKVPIENGSNKKFPLVIGENTFIPGFEDKLVGMKKDEEKEFELEFPKEYHAKQLAGKKATFKVKVLAVYERDLPELTDDFAKQLGDFKSMDDVKKKMKENMEQEEKLKKENELEDEMMEKIIEKTNFTDIADVLINAETQKMMQELERNIAQQGISLDDYLQHIGKKRDELLLEFVPQGTKRVKSALIMREVADKEKIQATDAEVNEEIAKMQAQYGNNPDMEKQFKNPEYLRFLHNIITSRKTMDFLKEKMVQKS